MKDQSQVAQLANSELNSKDLERFVKGLNALIGKEYKRAAKIGDKLAEKHPQSSVVQFLLIQCDEQNNQPENAIARAQAAVKDNPHNFLLRKTLGHLYLGQQDDKQAQLHLEQALASAPEDPELIAKLSDLYVRTQQNDKMCGALEKLKAIGNINNGGLHLLAQRYSELDFNQLDEQGIALKAQNLIDLSHTDNIPPRLLRIATAKLLTKKYGLDDDNAQLDLASLCQDEFLLQILPFERFIGAKLDELLTGLRHSLLNMIGENGQLPPIAQPLMTAMALQNQINEYVHFISQDEKLLLGELEKLLRLQMEAESWQLADSEALLLTLALYQPLYDLPQHQQLLAQPLDHWPNSLQQIAQATLFDSAEEIERAKAITSLTEIDDEISQKVRQQYEQNPYPRWQKIAHKQYKNFAKILEKQLPHFENIPACFEQENIKVLIAGCGTGQQPMQLALGIPGAHITAVDISRRSLAYASGKAKEFNVGNIDFYHGDILKLGALEQKFDLILCSGVLHHMDDPMAGWTVLRDLLAPEGIMQIHLYSQIARREVSRQRDSIAQLEIQPDADSIRRYRQALIQQNSPLLSWGDFWSLSECRDLLFHFQEHQFTWPQIQNSCDQLGLEIIGVDTPKEMTRAYHRHYPDDPRMINTSNWHTLEQKYPAMFQTMYGFYCMHK